MSLYTPPPDKSVTLRALLLAAVADGASRVENPLYCADTVAALGCLEALGVRFCRDGNALIIEGRGLNGLKRPADPLDAGESAALARMLAGLMVGQAFPSEITGRGTLLKRPMTPATDALKKLGAKIGSAGGLLPLSVRPAKLRGAGISGTSSAQIKSALLLAGLYARGPVEIKEKFPTRDHTERLLALMGARLASAPGKVHLESGPLTARPFSVPGDVSSAAPFIAAALLSGVTLRVSACGLNPLRLGFVDALRRMGARLELRPAAAFPEPSGEILVFPSRLKGVKVAPAEIPSMIDEVPLLAVLAARATGVTAIGGLRALKTKESDRVKSTLTLLAALGAKASFGGGALRVAGPKNFSSMEPVETFNDHRIAMAAAAASTVCPGLEIKNPGCVDKSYPGFWKDFGKVFG